MKQLFKHLPSAAVAVALQDVGTLPAAHVQRAANGLPVAWRLFGFGPFRLTQDGQEYGGAFEPEHADEILAQAERKGTPVPLDAHHSLAELATALGIDETELAAALPGRRLTLAFGRLAKRADGLWLQDIEWTDLGRKLIAGGHFRYFSPVLRGLADGRLRITSVALTNNPALQGLDAIAAEDDGDDGCRGPLTLADLGVKRAETPTKKEQNVKTKFLELLGAVLCLDSIALADDGAVPAAVEDKLTQLRDELPGLRAAKALGAKVREVLALSADADLAKVEGTLQGIAAKAGAHDGLKTRIDALELEAENGKRAKIIERGLTEGKLTKAMVDGAWCKGQNAIALEAFLAVAPVIVTPGRIVDTGKLPGDSDSLALTDVDRKVAAACGLKPEDVEKAEKERRK